MGKAFAGFFLVFFVLATVGGWVAQGNEFFLYKVFAPQYEQVRRETFEQSRAYNAGTIMNIRAAQGNYITAPPDRRAGLASVIVLQYADYPVESLPKDLQNFMRCLLHHQSDNFDCSPNNAE